MEILSPTSGAEWHEGGTYVVRWIRRPPGATSVSVAIGGKDRGHLAMGLAAGVDSLLWRIPIGFVTGFGPERSDEARIRIEDAEDPAAGVASAPFTIRALAAADTPAVSIRGRSVIAFWRVPLSDAELEVDPGFATALDDLMYHWAETRPRLEAAGFAALDQPGTRFVLVAGNDRTPFAADRDSGDMGYVFVEPGRPPATLHGVHAAVEVLQAAARYFGE
ncbi:MAG TPA: hypothetical protein VF037_01320 [Gemmatimonadales bacterium]